MFDASKVANLALNSCCLMKANAVINWLSHGDSFKAVSDIYV